MQEKPGVYFKCIAVVRSSDEKRVKTAIYDLYRYARLTFAFQPRRCDPMLADNVLVRVMNEPLRYCCNSAGIVPIVEDPSSAINRIRKIHPPAHVIIVGPIHDIYKDIINYIDLLPELDLTLDIKAFNLHVENTTTETAKA